MRSGFTPPSGAAKRADEDTTTARCSAGSSTQVTSATAAPRAPIAATDTSAAESANMKGKAVEAFCNILAEIRAYGEGLMIAEQIPSKLADDVLKGTVFRMDFAVQQTTFDDAEIRCYVTDIDFSSEYSSNAGVIDFTPPGRGRLIAWCTEPPWSLVWSKIQSNG